MEIEKYYAEQALGFSRTVVRLRNSEAPRSEVRYWEDLIILMATYLMENLILKAQCQQYDADEASQQHSEGM